MSRPSASRALTALGGLREAGHLRALDVALARFLLDLDPSAPDALLVAAALCAHLESLGHSCLPLGDLRQAPLEVLGWPEAAIDPILPWLEALPADTDAALRAWGGCVLVACVSDVTAAGSEATPLVLWRARLYLRRYWRCERSVERHVLARVSATEQARSPDDMQRARACLSHMFGEPRPGDDPDWQRVACALALRSRLTLITGGPGTGKTYTAARLLVLLQTLHQGRQPLRVALAAPTGKAAARLRQSIDSALQHMPSAGGGGTLPDGWLQQLGPARTLHALLGARPDTRKFAHDANRPLEVDVLFVDEASMVHLEMMSALLEALPPEARLVLLGDRDQLASVEAGAVLGDLCQPGQGYDAQTAAWVRQLAEVSLPAPGGTAVAQQVVQLRKSHRFSGPIGQLALAVNAADSQGIYAAIEGAADGSLAFEGPPTPAQLVRLVTLGREGAPGGYSDYLGLLKRRPPHPEQFNAWALELLAAFEQFRVLSALREGPTGVGGLNPLIQRALAERNLLKPTGEWFEGRPVMVTRNSPSLGVFNGDVGVTLRPAGDAGLRVYFADGQQVRSVSVARLADVETAFAMTIHKSQGSEFRHVVMVLPDGKSTLLSRELVYTGMTRAQKALTILAADVAQLVQASRRQTRRFSGLGVAQQGMTNWL